MLWLFEEGDTFHVDGVDPDDPNCMKFGTGILRNNTKIT